MKKVRFWTEKSHSGSKYYNWMFTDPYLQNEFETEIGYTSSYSVRLSNHKRPPVVDDFYAYDHSYFIDTNNKEVYNNAKNYLHLVLNKYANNDIDINMLDDLLFNQDWKSIRDYLNQEDMQKNNAHYNQEEYDDKTEDFLEEQEDEEDDLELE